MNNSLKRIKKLVKTNSYYCTLKKLYMYSFRLVMEPLQKIELVGKIF